MNYHILLTLLLVTHTVFGMQMRFPRGNNGYSILVGTQPCHTCTIQEKLKTMRAERWSSDESALITVNFDCDNLETTESVEYRLWETNQPLKGRTPFFREMIRDRDFRIMSSRFKMDDPRKLIFSNSTHDLLIHEANSREFTGVKNPYENTGSFTFVTGWYGEMVLLQSSNFKTGSIPKDSYYSYNTQTKEFTEPKGNFKNSVVVWEDNKPSILHQPDEKVNWILQQLDSDSAKELPGTQNLTACAQINTHKPIIAGYDEDKKCYVFYDLTRQQAVISHPLCKDAYNDVNYSNVKFGIPNVDTVIYTHYNHVHRVTPDKDNLSIIDYTIIAVSPSGTKLIAHDGKNLLLGLLDANGTVSFPNQEKSSFNPQDNNNN